MGGDAVEADAGFATERLQLVPLTTRFGDRYDERECRSAEAHWREYGFGHWALLDRQTGAFIGSAEVHYAYRGVEGISVDEIEVGIEILPEYRGQGYATEAVTAAVVDTRRRTGADHLVAYTRPDHSVAIGLMEKIGFEFRSLGTGREGEPAAIYTLSRQA